MIGAIAARMPSCSSSGRAALITGTPCINKRGRPEDPKGSYSKIAASLRVHSSPRADSWNSSWPQAQLKSSPFLWKCRLRKGSRVKDISLGDRVSTAVDPKWVVRSSTATSQAEPGPAAPTEEEAQQLEQLKAYIRGRDDVNKVLATMADILDELGEAGEDPKVAIEKSAARAVAAHLEGLDRGFLMALDVEIKDSEKDKERKEILEMVKEQVLAQLTAQFPPQVRMVSLLTSTPDKENRREILCRAVAGGGVFGTVSGGKLEIPDASLDQVMRQADDLISLMEEKRSVSDRKLLARLVLVREEARSLVGGGIHDARNDTRNFRTVPQSHVDLLTALMPLSGAELRQRLTQILRGEREGADLPPEEPSGAGLEAPAGAVGGKARKKGKRTKKAREEVPVRPGIFLDSLARVTREMYTQEKAKGLERLQWIRKEILSILQEMAHPKE